jgi:hypothetical protein
MERFKQFYKKLNYYLCRVFLILAFLTAFAPDDISMFYIKFGFTCLFAAGSCWIFYKLIDYPNIFTYIKQQIKEL